MANIYVQMIIQELDTSFTSTDYATHGAPALGNYLAEQLIAYGMTDGSNEANDYANTCYEQLEPNILPEVPGTSGLVDPNRWQAVELSFAIDQSGEDSPRAGRRATWLPPSAQPRAPRSPSAISPRGRSTTASSGRLGPVLHLAVEITQVRR